MDFCNLCIDDGISNHAITWCTECEVFLCTDCEKHHKRSKASKEHSTMTTDNYRNLPKFMSETCNRCKEHDKKYEMFCSNHACLCCIQCISDKHGKCQDMKTLGDILRDIKSSAAIKLQQKDLKDLKESFQEVIYHLRDRIKRINIQKTKGIQDVRSMRKLLDDYFNKLEREILADLESKHIQLSLDVEELIRQIEYRAKLVDQMEEDFVSMTKYATELQTYIGLSKIEKATSQEATYLEELISGSQLDDKNLEVNMSSALQSTIKEEFEFFGNISINSVPHLFRVRPGRIDQAQMLVPMIPSVEEITPSLMKTLNVLKGVTLDVRACQMLPNGVLLLLDLNKNRIIKFNSDGIFTEEVMAFEESSKAYDICLVEDNIVAVTFDTVHKVVLVDVEEKQLIKTIQLFSGSFGVYSDGKVLVVSLKEVNKIIVLDLKDLSEKVLEGICVFRISLFKGKIYGTNYVNDTVCCHLLTGELLWTFTHENTNRPSGIAVDINGLVYFTSNYNNRIVVLSTDGKISKIIICKEDGLSGPYAIDINRESGIMLVSSFVGGSDCAQTFKI